MKRLTRRRPSPALVVSILALAVALGGTSYAAIKLPKKSVGTKQLKRNAVTGAKVRDGSLLSNDFAAGQIPKGEPGDRGPAGPEGPTGLKGDVGPALTAEPWRAIPLAAGWQNYGEGFAPAEYRKDSLGIVHLRGFISKNGNPAIEDTVLTLPTGYRPTVSAIVLPVATGSPSGAGTVRVATDGTMQYLSGPAAEKDFIDLTAVNFPTD